MWSDAGYGWYWVRYCYGTVGRVNAKHLAINALLGTSTALNLICLVGWASTAIRKRRLGTDLCQCGYCLRGNVSGTCPECGRTNGMLRRET
jgi:hypothetical protein